MKKIIIITIIFISKLISVIYLLYLENCQFPKTLYSFSGDATSYIMPWENLIQTGSYSWADNSPYAGRMPFVGLPFFLFRLFFSFETSLNLVVLLQLLLSSISIYYMGVLLQKIITKNFNNNDKRISILFWSYVIFSIISLYNTSLDYHILSESLTTSFLCLFAYSYYIYLSEKRNIKQLLIFSIFLTLSILWKPYYGLLYLLVGIEFLIHNFSNNYLSFYNKLKKTFLYSILSFSPLIIIDTPWIIRNYITFNKFIPLQKDIYAEYYEDWYLEYMYFTKKIGESIVFWDKRSFGCYFEDFNEFGCEYKLPNRILGNNLTKEKIEEQKKLFLLLKKNPKDSLLKKRVIDGFRNLFNDYIKDHPYSYWIVPPIIHIKRFLFHSGSYYFPLHKNLPCYNVVHLIIKLVQSLLYYLCLILGFLGLLKLLFKDNKSFILLSIPTYTIIIICIVFLLDEFRYFHPSYPFLSFGMLFLFFDILYRFKIFKIFNSKKIN